MTAQLIRYVTVHWVRLPEVVTPDSPLVCEQPAGCLCWRLGVAGGPMGADGDRPPTNVWCGLGLFSDLESAESTVDQPARYLSCLPQPIESWHALLLPVAYRGICNYVNGQGSDLNYATASPDPGGHLFIITSGGFDFGPEFDRTRPVNSRGYSDRDRGELPPASGRVMSEYFTPPPADDATTMSLWVSDEAMVKTMYGPGIHREEVDRFKREKSLDRTSFTRFRVLRARGRWDGVDPMDAARIHGS